MNYYERCAVTMSGQILGYVVIETRDDITTIRAEVAYRNASPLSLGLVASKEEGIQRIADRFTSLVAA